MESKEVSELPSEEVSDKGLEWRECWGLLKGAQNEKYSEVSPELRGGRSPKNAEDVRGRSWKNSKMFSEQKTGRPLTSPMSEHVSRAPPTSKMDPEVHLRNMEEELIQNQDRKSTRLNSSHSEISRMPSSA